MVTTQLTLTKPQSKIWTAADQYRFIAVCAGRRFGKTFLVMPKLYAEATKGPNRNVVYIAPTWKLAHDLMWRPLQNFIPDQFCKHKNKSTLEIELHNGSIISLMSGDNPNSSVGRANDFVAMDEAALLKTNEVWEYTSPTLVDRRGSAWLITSPRGLNWFFDLWKKGRDDYGERDPDWLSFQFTTMDGGNVHPSEIERERRLKTEKMFRQEYLASFETLAGLVYENFSLENISETAQDCSPEVLIGMDFNVNPMSAVVGSMTNSGNELNIWDEIILENSNTQEMSQVIRDRFPNRRIVVFPDASGASRRTSSNTTDHAIMRSFGFEVYTGKSNPAISDRINEVNAMFCNAQGQRRLRIHPRCKYLIGCLRGLTYKEGTNLPDKSLNKDHAPDALGYMVHSLFPLKNYQTAIAEECLY